MLQQRHGRSADKITCVSATHSSFISQDFDILSKHFDAMSVQCTSIRDVCSIMSAVATSYVSYSWFANTQAFFAVLASKLFRKQAIVIAGGHDVADEPEINYGMCSVGFVRRFMRKYALKHADSVIAVSEFTKHEAENYANNVKLVYNGVDTDKFHSDGTKENMVLTVGSKITLKGLDVFVEAARCMPDLRFVIIGDVTESFKATMPANVDVFDNMSQDKIVKYYQRAKVYCQLSYRESFGVSLAEAMACGCVPVVASRGAMPEVVGDTGLYVPYGDIEKTVVAIKTAFESPPVGQRDRVRQCFSVRRRESALKTMIGACLKDRKTRLRLRKSVKLADIKENESVLDVGCGDSVLKAFLPDGVSYVGVDRECDDVLCDLEQGIPEDLLSQKFDIIFLNEFIEHIEHFKSILIQCRDMLTKNGRIILSTPSPNRLLFKEDPTHIHCFRKSNLINLAAICNLQVDTVIGTYIGIPMICIPSDTTVMTGVMIYKLLPVGAA